MSKVRRQKRKDNRYAPYYTKKKPFQQRSSQQLPHAQPAEEAMIIETLTNPGEEPMVVELLEEIVPMEIELLSESPMPMDIELSEDTKP